MRARSKETQPAATGGRCGARGGRGGAGFSEAEFRPRCAKWESVQRGCVVEAIEGEERSEGPLGRRSPVPPARRGMGEGKWDELTAQGFERG